MFLFAAFTCPSSQLLHILLFHSFISRFLQESDLEFEIQNVCVCVASIQLQNYSRQLGMNNKVRATVAPLPSSSATSSSSSLGPPPSKASRPALNFLSSSSSGSSRAPTRQEGNDDDDDDNSVLIQ